MSIYLAVLNFAIMVGYLVVAVGLLPYLQVRRRWLKVAVVTIFVTCSLTHGEMAVVALLGEHITTPFTVVNHSTQALSVWVAIVGFHLEYVVDPVRNN